MAKDTFIAHSKNGNLSLGSRYNRNRFKKHLEENNGMRYRIEPEEYESNDMRAFFEGGVVALATFYQENLHHANWRHREMMRKRLMLEFNAELVPLGDRGAKKVAKSSKGKETLNLLIERVIDWMGEQGYQIEWLKPKEYKTWRDEIYKKGMSNNFIDYLVETGRLHDPFQDNNKN